MEFFRRIKNMAYSKTHISPQEKAVLTSIAYSDIFNFPLNRDELWKFLISKDKIPKREFESCIQKLESRYIVEKDGYFSLKGREAIIESRKKNALENDGKLKIAKKAAFYLSHIKSILFIGISGGLAMGDVEGGDDIDFFVITKNNTIFKSRFLVLLILQMLGMRRKREDTNPSDKICINFIIDTEKLYFPKERHDVYTAHEIIQIVPLYEAHSTFHKFKESNKWLNNFFPNSREATEITIPKFKKNIIFSIIFFILNVSLSEKLCRLLQSALINKHLKNEIVTNHVLAFNPNDYRVQTLKKLRLKLHELGLLTKD